MPAENLFRVVLSLSQAHASLRVAKIAVHFLHTLPVQVAYTALYNYQQTFATISRWHIDKQQLLVYAISRTPLIFVTLRECVCFISNLYCSFINTISVLVPSSINPNYCYLNCLYGQTQLKYLY